MNCLTFETIINDLARSPLMDAEARVSGLAHAENCARCASRLADEKALTQGLRALSACAAPVEAPARVEAALLAAFRAGASVEAKGASIETKEPAAAPVVLRMSQWMRPRWSWKAGAAVAAAILFAVTLSLARFQPQQQRPASSQAASPRLAQRVDDATATQTPSGVETGNALPVTPVTNASGPETLAVNRETTRPRKLTTQYRTDPYQTASLRAGPVRGSNQVVNPNKVNPNNASRIINAGSNASEAEIATDFMPLTYDGGALAMESGHVVRVELPRTALVSMGLPMNPERAGELVKADVLMGDDGVARAIRFVR